MAAGPNPSPDDLQLMDAIAAGDRAAVALLFDRHGAVLLGICRRVLHNADDADDVLAEVFQEVWARAGRYDAGRGGPLTYLVTLARSRSIDHKRRLAARPPLRSDVGADLATRPDGAAGPAQHADAAEQYARVRAALGTLDADQRAALESAYFDGLTHTEVARRLGKPLGTVKTYIRQGLIRLRTLLRTDQEKPDATTADVARRPEPEGPHP